MIVTANGYTPTEKRMLAILSDGLPHNRQELHACIRDELTPLTAIQPHISNIRKKLRITGEEIVCELTGGTIHYRHVRLLSSPYDGRT